MKKIIIIDLSVLASVIIFKIMNNVGQITDTARHFIYQNYIREIVFVFLVLVLIFSFIIKPKKEKVISILISIFTIAVVWFVIQSITNISSSGGV